MTTLQPQNRGYEDRREVKVRMAGVIDVGVSGGRTIFKRGMGSSPVGGLVGLSAPKYCNLD